MAKEKILTYDGLSFYDTKLKGFLESYKEVKFCSDDLERQSISSPSNSNIYIVLSPLSLYIYDGTWKNVFSQEEITDEFIDNLFVGDEQGVLFNTINPISDETINNIWDSV